jgi:Domain of unknown function (DUF1905)
LYVTELISPVSDLDNHWRRPIPMTQTAKLDLAFTAPLRRDTAPGAWTIAVLPDSGRLLGTRKPVKVGGDIDGQPFHATLLPMGDGTHMVPIKATLRTAVGKGDGDQVAVRLTERYS